VTPNQLTTPDTAAVDTDGYADVAGLYDLFAAAQGDSALPQVPPFTALAQPGTRVLDVGAGTGRVALAVAERRAHVWCVEPSASMRSALLAKLAGRRRLWPYLTVTAGSAPGLALTGVFDYAYLAGSLQFLSATDRRRTFVELAAHLRPGAPLALDMVEAEPAVPRVDPAETVVAETEAGQCRYRLSVRVLAATHDWADIFYRYVAECGGRRSVHQMRRRRYGHRLADVQADLAAAGFAPATAAGAASPPPDPTEPIVAWRNP
jgi:SAM-dependent methyltransferase